MSESIDVFIVTYRSEAYLPRLLADMASMSERPHNLRVIDNTGNRKTLTRLWNELWSGGSSEYVAILNPDIILSPGWDARLQDCLQARPDVAVAMANRYFSVDGTPDAATMGRLSREHGVRPSYNDLGEHLEGFYAFMTRRSVLKRLEGFDERFRFYFSDSDFQIRALRLLGLKTTQVNHCLIGHMGAVSTHEAGRRGELDREAELHHVEETKAGLLSGRLKPWHELSSVEREGVRRDPSYARLSGRQPAPQIEENTMKLSIDNIYSPEGRRALIEAFTKSMWSDEVFHRTYWAGVPLLQIPEDMVMIAEIIWKLRPKLIVECGIWHGGGLVYYSSLLQHLGGEVIGVDVHIGDALHVKRHPFGGRITLIQASSTDPKVIEMIKPRAGGNVIVILDSNHSAAHVLAELNNFAPLIKPGGYLIVLDGIMKILHDAPRGEARWQYDNPEVAVGKFLASHPEFERDPNCEKFGVTYGPGGYLRRK